MRITSNQLANLVRRSVGDNTEKLYKAQETVSTRKLVNRPSDDPLAMGRILDYRTTLVSIGQYARNIDLAKLNIEFSEKQLEEVGEQLQSAKNLLVGQSNADASSRQQTADDIHNIYDRLMDIANTKLGNEYIFAGHQNGPEPVSCAEVSCKAGMNITHGDYFTVGTNHYVWYDKKGDGSGDPQLDGMIGIEVDVDDSEGEEAVAANTVSAIDAVADFTCAPDTIYPEWITIEWNSNPEVICQAADDLEAGDYFTLGSDYFVWYDKDSDETTDKPTDSSLSGKTGIRVELSAGDDADAVASATKTKIDDVLDLYENAIFETAVSGDTLDIIWKPYDVPDIADGSSDFTIRTKKYEETAPFTPCAEISYLKSESLESGDYFTLGSDYYVWYDKNGDGSTDKPKDSFLDDRTEIVVDISPDDKNYSVEEVRALTVTALNAILDDESKQVFSASVSADDASRMEIEFANGSLPEIADINTGFTMHTAKYNGDDGDLDFIVSKTLKIKGNATGNEAFTGEGRNNGVNIFDTLKALKDALEAPTYDSDLVSNIKDDLVKGMNQVERAAVDLSVAYTRLESSENYWNQFKLTVENMRSESEDVDLAQAIVELQHQETVYEAALAASAKLFSQSLIDFLR